MAEVAVRVTLAIALASASTVLASCSRKTSVARQEGVETYSLSANTPTPGNTGPGRGSIEYTRELGGSAHAGERLWLIVGRVAQTEAEAQEALDQASLVLEESSSHFIVQHSDGFDGLPIDQWVVIEAHESKPPLERVELVSKAFSTTEVVEVYVKTSDPIPVSDPVDAR